jgi:DNA polymerase-4
LFLGLTIKQRLYQEVGEWVSASVGIAPNKLVAKIAADLGEGDLDRIAVVRREDFPKLYDRLVLTDIPGIGRRLESALNKLGIYNLKELAQYPEANLINHFGIWGRVLHDLANFSDDSEVEAGDEAVPKSVGHYYTMAKATDNPAALKKLMFKLAEKIGRRMRKYGARGSVVHYFHSDRRYESFSRQRKLTEYINDGRDIYQAVLKIFEANLKYPVKIMGLTVSGLIFEDPPEPLFEEFKRPLRLVSATDRINDKYGEFTMARALLLGAHEEWAKDTVGFGRTRMK